MPSCFRVWSKSSPSRVTSGGVTTLYHRNDAATTSQLTGSSNELIVDAFSARGTAPAVRGVTLLVWYLRVCLRQRLGGSADVLAGLRANVGASALSFQLLRHDFEIV